MSNAKWILSPTHLNSAKIEVLILKTRGASCNEWAVII